MMNRAAPAGKSFASSTGDALPHSPNSRTSASPRVTFARVTRLLDSADRLARFLQ